jgi:fructokinase
MRSDLCVVGIGEVLMDVFEDGHVTVGGAPLNVIFHVNQLICALAKGKTLILSAVSDDPWGRQIRSTLARAEIGTRYLANVEHPTGSALVLEYDGGAGFEIQADVAWDFIQVDHSALELARRCDATVFGTLAQRSPTSRESIQRFVSQVSGHRLYDLNLRRSTGNGTPGYSAEVIEESLKLATLAKMNDAELDEVCKILGLTSESGDVQERLLLRMERLAHDFALDAVAVTRGSKGALLWGDKRHLSLADSPFDQSMVHPVGAGDSFAAGLLFGILQGWLLEESLDLANILSSYVVQQVSATPPLPKSVLTSISELADRANATATRGAS